MLCKTIESSSRPEYLMILYYKRQLHVCPMHLGLIFS